MEIVRLLIGDTSGRARLIDNNVINHTRISHVYVMNTNVSAGFDRGFDHFAILVHNVTRPFENITARSIRTVLTNNESFERLIIGRRPFLSCHFDDRSRYGYGLLYGSGCLFALRRTRLGKCHRRNKCAAGENNNCIFYHDASLLMFTLTLRPLDILLNPPVQHSLVCYRP
jgi:hypothetical protein